MRGRLLFKTPGGREGPPQWLELKMIGFESWVVIGDFYAKEGDVPSADKSPQ